MCIIILVILFSLLQNSLGEDLQKLLMNQIASAQCSSKCLNQPTSKDFSLCFEICQLKQENPDTDICKFPKMCTGGCRTACEEDSEEQVTSKFMQYSISRCSFRWKMKTIKDVVFVAAGLDEGNMWHFLKTTSTNSIHREAFQWN